MSLKIYPPIIVLMLMTGCASTQVQPLSYQASQIHFQKQDSNLLASCRRLGPVSGFGRDTYGLFFLTEEFGFQAAMKDIRENAVRMGADTIVLTSRDGMMSSESRFLGIAYRCF